MGVLTRSKTVYGVLVIGRTVRKVINMRDINRIDPFLKELEKLWKKCPDLRFGQIIYMLADGIGRDIFFPEEDEWLKVICNEIDKRK